MIRDPKGTPGRLVATLACMLAWATAPVEAKAEDIYFQSPVSSLTITEGALPKAREADQANQALFTAEARAKAAIQPYAIIDGGGEVYLDRPVDDARVANQTTPLGELASNDLVAFRLADRREVTGRLFLPSTEGKGMVAVSFKVTPPPAKDGAKQAFALAKSRHYQRLITRGVPGTAWFNHQVREALALAPDPNALGRPARSRTDEGDELDPTFDLFSGQRAINDNLQLDRQFQDRGTPGNPAGQGRVKVADIKGITVAEMDWSARIAEKNPRLDPLASSIPADQHALFFPGVGAVAAVLGNFDLASAPVMGLMEARSEDQHVQSRYEKQLGVSFADLSRFAAQNEIRGLALTGSDPYLPSGTDVAVLFDAAANSPLPAFLKGKVDEARRAALGAVAVEGEVDGVRFAGARTPDRVLCSYVATLGNVVVLCNSPAQLARLIEVAHGKTPGLASQPEYRFFRDRYPIGGGETAFLILTDATIRRWCGPRWRIGSSRRLRASATLAEQQAASLPRPGVRSEVYGSLAFMTPIVEIPLDEVEASEAAAYERWRVGYQQNWRGTFDPIAVQLALRPDRVTADVSVMPLIANSTYREIIEFAGNARIAPGAGDPHPGAFFHAVMALDVQSKLLGGDVGLVASLIQVSKQIALGWIGPSASVFVDEDPFWAQLVQAKDSSKFLEANLARIPIGANVEVTDGAKLAIFLAALRAYINQSAPNLTVWETREHRGKGYVRVAESAGSNLLNGTKIALYYYASSRSLTLSLNEDVVRRAIDRQEDKAGPVADPAPWLGRSLALRANRRGFDTLSGVNQADLLAKLRDESWDALPILNEWKRLYPDLDPVEFHRQVWGSTLVEPGGGKYAWNARWATMESTVFGHPGEPLAGPASVDPFALFQSAQFGISFEDGGLRAKAEIEVRPKP